MSDANRRVVEQIVAQAARDEVRHALSMVDILVDVVDKASRSPFYMGRWNEVKPLVTGLRSRIAEITNEKLTDDEFERGMQILEAMR